MARPTPYEVVQARLRPTLGDRVERLPRKWERLGDVLVVRLSGAGLDPSEEVAVAAAFADAIGARVVLEDIGGVSGPLRQPNMRRLWGEGPTTTGLLQDGIRYRLDPARVMFSSGNLEERIRMARLDARGETVVDLFAGIGYFTLPLLVHAGAERVIACELNPDSVRFLAENAEANNIVDRLEIRTGDCRQVAPRGVADRVLLGYFPGGHAFLDTALASLKPTGGVVHYHDTAKADGPEVELRDHLRDALDGSRFMLRSQSFRVVKSHSPGVVHGVLDAELRPGGAS